MFSLNAICLKNKGKYTNELLISLYLIPFSNCISNDGITFSDVDYKLDVLPPVRVLLTPEEKEMHRCYAPGW